MDKKLVYIFYYKESKQSRLQQTILHQLLNGVFVFVKEGNGVRNRVHDTPHKKIGLNFLVLVREGVIETIEILLANHRNTWLFRQSRVLGNRRRNILGSTLFHLSFVNRLGSRGGLCCQRGKARRATEGSRSVHGGVRVTVVSNNQSQTG